LEDWKIGRLEVCKKGGMQEGRYGRREVWKKGGMEDWKVGGKEELKKIKNNINWKEGISIEALRS
jgi:hypothetical protein